MSRSILVVGSNRSGTSTVAGMLSELGVYFGETEHLYAADRFNERGYFEHKSVSAAIRKFHTSLNLASLTVDPIPNDWSERPMTATMCIGFANLLATRLAVRDVWGWKDPQASTLLPFVREAYRKIGIEPAVVICVREPYEVAVSQGNRHGTPFSIAISGWLLSTLAALRDSRGLGRIVVDYRQVLEAPSEVVDVLISSLGLGKDEERRRRAADFVNSGLSHGRPEGHNHGPVPPIVDAVYELAVEASRHPHEFRKGSFDGQIESRWQEWRSWREMFALPPIPEATFIASWSSHGEERVVSSHYRPSRGWQTIRLELDALPGSRLSLSIYPLPAMVWIRRAEWVTATKRTPADLREGSDGQFDEYAGYRRVWLFHGAEQLAAFPPMGVGPFVLEMEILVETGNVITGLTIKDLCQRLRV